MTRSTCPPRTRSRGLILLSLLTVVLSACGADPPMAPDAEAIDAPPEETEASRVVRGTFAGLAGHAARGAVTFTVRGEVGTVTLHDDFASTRVPDPWIYVNTVADANEGRALRVARLERSSGPQEYSFRIPGGAPEYSYVLVWCDRFNVGVGAAVLN